MSHHNVFSTGFNADSVLELDAGANDYVTKLFKFSVLLARIGLIFVNLNKPKMPPPGALCF